VADRIEELRRRLEKDPGSRLFAQLAEQLRKEGELEEAIQVARTGLDQHPNYPSARLTLGRALLDSGDAEAARTELETALGGAPDNILASRLLGETLEALGDLKGAVKQLQSTLLISPGDAQIQARIAEIEARLAKPPPPEEPIRQDHTAPMQALKPEEGRGGAPPAEATGAEPPAPPAPGDEAPGAAKPPPASVEPPSGAAPAADDGEPPIALPIEEGAEEGGLPPTIRIRMPGDPVAEVRAPMPPSGGRVTAGSVEETTVPPPAQPDTEEGGGPLPEPGVDPSPVFAPEDLDAAAQEEGVLEAESSDQAPTLPTSKAAELAGAEDLPPTVPPGAMATEEPSLPAAGSPARAEQTPLAEETIAPEPGAPVGDVTAPQGLDARGAGARPAEAPRPAPPSTPSPASSRAPAARSEGREPTAEPPLAAEAAASPVAEPTAPSDGKSPETTSRPLEPGGHQAAVGSMAPLLQEGGPEPPAPAASGSAAEGGGGKALSSATLAELYLEQGLLERAIEVYREVVAVEPGNDAARTRVAELEARLRASAVEGPPEGGDATELKRRTLERTIARLEALLEVVKRR